MVLVYYQRDLIGYFRNMFELDYNASYDLNEFVTGIIAKDLKTVYKKSRKGGYYVYNVPCSFDIETSSFLIDGRKQAIMYVWQFGFNGKVVIGRDWEQFITLLKMIQERLSLESGTCVLYCYIHNLSYEFQFMRKRLKWENVFSVDTRKPIKALCEYGIEFRDSYILSGYSLETVGNNLHTYTVKKLSGYLDYDLIRTPNTPLNEKEISYCVNDVLVVMAYIQEYIESVGKITNIPLTQTGGVRKFCRKNCYHGFSDDTCMKRQTYYDYRSLMSSLTLDLDEYKLLKRAFQGGFTHANAKYVRRVESDVSSYDFTSSYPYVMISEQFPMGKGFKVKDLDFDKFNTLSQTYLMVFDVKLTDVSPKIDCDNPISISRCYHAKNQIVNNGRVVFADEIALSCTSIDLEVYLAFYNIKHIDIGECYCYSKGYLPKNFILSILKVYNDKTKLKGVVGKEREYLHSKELLNSMYGMSVTDVIQDLITYDDIDGWGEEIQDEQGLIEKYNNAKDRFLFYPWGVFVTAYARKNLFSGILECKDDYIYSDTDSIKILNKESHKQYFDDYNNMVIKKLEKMCDFYHIPFELTCPETIKGVRKQIGLWDYEGCYAYFKTLGAKRYIYFDKDDLHVTIAGVSKKGVVDYFNDKYNNVSRETFKKKVLHDFDNSLVIPCEYTHKLTHTYIDDNIDGMIQDYKGDWYEYHEKSCIHLSKTDYNMSLSQAFIDFLKGVHTYNVF